MTPVNVRYFPKIIFLLSPAELVAIFSLKYKGWNITIAALVMAEKKNIVRVRCPSNKSRPTYPFLVLAILTGATEWNCDFSGLSTPAGPQPSKPVFWNKVERSRRYERNLFYCCRNFFSLIVFRIALPPTASTPRALPHNLFLGFLPQNPLRKIFHVPPTTSSGIAGTTYLVL